MDIIDKHLKGPNKKCRIRRFVEFSDVELCNLKYMGEIGNLTGPLDLCRIMRFCELYGVELYGLYVVELYNINCTSVIRTVGSGKIRG